MDVRVGVGLEPSHCFFNKAPKHSLRDGFIAYRHLAQRPFGLIIQHMDV